MPLSKSRQWIRSSAGFEKQQIERARSVVTASSGIVRGKFPSRKNGRMMHHEGLLELAAFYWLESMPMVIDYREQPFQMSYPDGERIRRYTPDICVTLEDGELLYVEIKASSSLARPELAHKYRAVNAQFKRDGIAFTIWSDTALRREPELSNIQWIYRRSRKKPTNARDLETAAFLLRILFPLSILKAASILEAHNIDLFALLLDGRFEYCDHQKISDETLLTAWTSPESHQMTPEQMTMRSGFVMEGPFHA